MYSLLICVILSQLVQDECGETALFAACGMGCYDPAALLIDHRADVNYLRKVRPCIVHGHHSVWVIDACRNSWLNCNLEQFHSVLFCALQ